MWRLAISLLLMPLNAFAGAWLQPKDSGRQVIANFNYYKASQAFDVNGVKYTIADYKKYEFNPYIEYGLLDNLTIGGSFAAKAVNNEFRGKNSYGVDDVKLFARSYLYQGQILGYDGFVISAEPGLFLPLQIGGELNSQSGVSPSLKLNLGRSTEDYYTDFTMGYEYWQGKSDKIATEASYGYYLNSDFTLLTQAFSEISVTRDFTDSADYDLNKTQVSLVWESSEKISHQVGVTYDLAGRNTGAGYGLLYSLWYKF